MSKDGMNYAPSGKPAPVVKPGEFPFAAAALDHGHIYGQCNGLIEAGSDLRYVYDPDPAKVAAFIKNYPQAKPVNRLETILDDPAIKLVASAAIPCDRGPLGLRVMESGKDYFTDKTPFTSLDQLDAARATAKRTGKKYMVYYSERLHVESAIFAGDLIAQGAIGRVVSVLGLGPHRLNAPSRPAWFFDRKKYGGILTDIGSHQIEQFLFYAGAKDAEVTEAAVGNYANPDYPELEDYATPTLSPTTARPIISASTGSTPTASAPGATAAPSSSAPPATSSSANTSTSRATPAATSSSSSTARRKSHSRSTARSATPTSASSSSTASTAPRTP